MNDLLPVKCDTCGLTMPRGVADNSETHPCAKTWPADPRLTDDPTDFGPDGYQYGFIADDSDSVVAYAFGSLPFHNYKAAMHTCSKCYWETYLIVRRKPGENWKEAPNE